ncbi:MAG: hypothetical protein Q8Q01_00495 [archaeon]|nr:hypothetical protein [archaeon]
MKNKSIIWITLIVIVTLAIRLYLAFTIPELTHESYFHIKQVEHIQETGFPLFYDALSYGGRELRFLPLFHYIVAAISMILPLGIVAKVLPNIFLVLIVPIVYLMGLKISKNETGAIIAAFIAAFLPITFMTNSFTTTSLFLPLIFLTIYAFMEKKTNLYLISFLLATLTSSATFLLIIGFGIYLLLSLLEAKKIQKYEIELILFSLFFYTWSQFIFFKEVLIKEGFSFIWQNIPPQIVAEYFPTFSIIQVLVLISVIPFLAGIFTVYLALFQLKNQKSFLLISFAISTTLLAWLKVIPFFLSLAFFGIILATIFASFYSQTVGFLQKTKFINKQRVIALIFLIVLIPSITIPAVNNAFNQEVPTAEEISAFQWIAKNTPPDAGVLATLEEGNLLTYYGQRRNIMDSQFALIDNAELRFQDLNSLYSTSFETRALHSLDEHKITYLMLTPFAQKKYDLKQFKYLTSECFEQVYRNETIIYKAKCTLEKQ